MDDNRYSFDALYSEPLERGSLPPWDELLVCVRRRPQLAAFDAAMLARSRPEATAGTPEAVDGTGQSMVAGIAGPMVFAEAEDPEIADRAPTWDGLDTVIADLRGQDLLHVTLPTTRSPTVMLTYLIEELALVFAGHRGDRPDHNIVASDLGLDQAQVRFETECITWLISGRLGLRSAAAGSLKGYLKDGDLMPPISRDRVLRTVDAVEGLFGGAPALGDQIRQEVPSLFSLDEPLAV
ncbi:dual specificity protein phosphatase family protein [Brevibacterium atlanticum]|uniref:dual specificity protein phosphatase family protein n=1 Tax=Brevibacterium atlanticum TaxID=2697563 RepID=UPI00141E64F0|nr:dual specificity protein phosphatase family protein [Brevibacterium atlanticum]